MRKLWAAFVFIQVLAFFFVSTSAIPTNTTSAVLLTVDQSGKGDFLKIQDAIDAVPSGNSEPVFILINPGLYNEKVTVPTDKPFITLSGTNATNTIISWRGRRVTRDAATLAVKASDFVARNLTIQNTFGRGTQAVALSLIADRAAFYSCRIISYQDTIYDTDGQRYYKDCYIEGATDFICGDGLAYFDNCHLHSTSKYGGAITAQKRSSEEENTGYSFVSCRITGVERGRTCLGRPWGPYSRVVFAFTRMSDAVGPSGWNDWSKPERQRTSFYGEYQNSGPGADTSKRVGWARELSSDEAAPFLTISMINGQDWLTAPPTQFKKPSFLNSKE